MSIRERLKKVIDDVGIDQTTKLFKLGENSILRYLGDVQFSRGTASVIETEIGQIEKAAAALVKETNGKKRKS